MPGLDLPLWLIPHLRSWHRERSTPRSASEHREINSAPGDTGTNIWKRVIRNVFSSNPLDAVWKRAVSLHELFDRFPTMPPPSRRYCTSSNPACSMSHERSSAPGKRHTLARRYVYAFPSGSTLPAAGRHVEPEAEERSEDPGGARDLEHCDFLGRSTRLSSRRPTSRSSRLRNAEADGRCVELALLERQGEGVSLHPLDRPGLPTRALEHPLGEVEPDYLPASLLGSHGEIARATAGIEHAVSGPDDQRGGQPSPALVEPHGHDAVHDVVDRGDARRTCPGRPPERACRTRASRSPQRLTSALSMPIWSRQRATTKSTRSSIEGRDRCRSPARRRGDRARLVQGREPRRWIDERGVSRGTSTSFGAPSVRPTRLDG